MRVSFQIAYSNVHHTQCLLFRIRRVEPRSWFRLLCLCFGVAPAFPVVSDALALKHLAASMLPVSAGRSFLDAELSLPISVCRSVVLYDRNSLLFPICLTFVSMLSRSFLICSMVPVAFLTGEKYPRILRMNCVERWIREIVRVGGCT